jgi:hypothetical protein
MCDSGVQMIDQQILPPIPLQLSLTMQKMSEGA